MYGKKVPVKVKVVDTESDPTKETEVAYKLVLRDKVDLMVTMHTQQCPWRQFPERFDHGGLVESLPSI